MKPGWKTSEFWISLVSTLVGAVAASGAVPSDSPYMQLAGLVTATIIPAIYAFLRNQQKVATTPDGAVTVQQIQAAVDAGKLPPFTAQPK